METAFALILANNIAMSGVKWLANESATVTWLRCMLAFVSIMGVISAAALNGTPVDFNQISGLAKLIAEAALLALASHFSYKAIKTA